MNIQGKRAIVFGGTSGIGLATATQLAELGATVTAVSRNTDKAGSVHPSIRLNSCNVLDEAGLKDLFQDHGNIDILISAATGGERAIGPFLEMDMAGYRASFDKLWGYANVVRFGSEHLSPDGVVILVSGSPARRAGPGQSALSSVGGAVENLMRAVAKELAPRRINVVSPGLIDTPMFPVEGEQREQFFAGATAHQLIPRAGSAEEIAQAIVSVVQNDFITGAVFDVDGGAPLS